MVLKKNKQLLSNLGGIEYKIIQGKIKDHSSNCKFTDELSRFKNYNYFRCVYYFILN